jgi:hypothetical protein
MAKLQFGEWLPDLPPNENPGAIEAKNCIPKATSYEQFKALAPFGSALGDIARGSFWLRSNSGAAFNFAADANTLYLFDGVDTWDDVSKPANLYSADAWDFVNFQNRVIATDGGASDVQYFDVGVSSAFDDLPGGPPRCKVLGVVRDFVLMGNYEIGSEIESGGLAWSGFNNTELWTPAQSTQSGRRRTRGDGGAVVRIVSGTQGLVYREHGILLVRYVGPPNIFQVDDITSRHGTPAGRSVCWTKDLAFYLSTEGFYQLNRQSLELTAIGVNKVDQWFREHAAPGDIFNVQGSVDRLRNLVLWAFRSSTSSPTFDRLIVYNWATKRWAYAELETEWISEFVSIGYNLDTIGAVLGGDIDSASINVDSQAFAGGALALQGFNSAHRAGTFDGDPLVAEIDTSEQGPEGKRGYVNGVRPIIESTTSPTVSVAPVTRNRVQDNPMVGSFKAVNGIGQSDLRVNARYHRYRVRIAGGFTHASRVEFEMKTRGRR